MLRCGPNNRPQRIEDLDRRTTLWSYRKACAHALLPSAPRTLNVFDLGHHVIKRFAAELSLETLDKFFVAHKLWRNQFQRHITLSAEVRCQVHCPHAALPEESLEAVLIIESLTNVTFERGHSLESG